MTKKMKNKKIVTLLALSAMAFGVGGFLCGESALLASAGTATVTVPPSATTAVEMLGASIRYISDTEDPNTGSIRFGMELSEADYQAVIDSDVTVGMLILPGDKLKGELTFETPEVGIATVYGGTDKKVDAFKETVEGTYEAYVYVWDIPQSKWSGDLCVRGFIQKGEDKSLSAQSVERSVIDVALSAYNDPETNASNKTKLETYLNGTELSVTFGETETKYMFGSEFNVPANPTKAHYDFVGWCLQGSEDLYDFTADNAKIVTQDMVFVPKFVRKGVVATETFANGTVVEEEKYYQGPVVNVGSRANSSTMNAVTVNENGFVWSSATTGDGRIMFRYNGYDGLDFTGGKKYAIRVALTTPANYPDAGYIMVYGFKADACDSYKIANAGTDKIVTSEGGSTARKVLGGKNMTTYFDFILDGTQSSEFFVAYHSASNSGKVGMTADVTVSKVEIIDLSAYEALGATETFEEDTVSVSGLSYTGTNFDVIAAAGDMMSIANHPAPQLSMYTSGKGLYWVSPRVWKEGLQTNDEGNEVTHNAKLVFTYKGEYDADGSYRIRIPLYMKANTPDQVKTTKVKLFYATAGTYSEKLLETKTIGWTQTASVFEVVIPAGSNWNGQLVMRMYNDEITANSAGSKMLCYFDGLSVEAL